MLSSGIAEFHVYTDGTFDAKSRSGAWAFIAMEGERRFHDARGTGAGESNNSFELMAAAEAMAWIDACLPAADVHLWTDSRYVLEGCTRSRHIWRNNGWKRIDPNPRARRRAIPDAALWQTLDVLLDRNPKVMIAWCKAHSGITGNEEADAFARSVPAK